MKATDWNSGEERGKMKHKTGRVVLCVFCVFCCVLCMFWSVVWCYVVLCVVFVRCCAVLCCAVWCCVVWCVELCVLSMDLVYMCVKPQMRLYVCHQMRLLNLQRSSLRSLTFVRFARTFFNSLNLNSCLKSILV